MRVDGKPEGLRQSMSWLHTWSGLLLGWLLYAVFFTGTLSYFVDEINDWMRPELHASVAQADTAEKAVAGMQKLAPDASSWSINLPDERHTAVEVTWRPKGAPQGREGTQRAQLDASTGEVIPVRETRGGSFLYRFHFELYAMPRVWGRWIVGIATFVMLVAIISGVITHKKIFTDFFTFRPRKGQRSWLDAHNATAVLALPFHIVITFSGLLLLMTMLMPWGAYAVYDGEPQRFNAERRGMQAAPAQQGGPQQAAREGRGEGRERKAAEPQAMAPIGPMLQVAQAHWQGGAVGSISVQNPNTQRATVELRAERADSLLLGRAGSQRVVLDGVTGALKEVPEVRQPSTAMAVMNSMVSVHLGRFAGPAVRWLLFLSGLVGTCMAATGLVLWVVKRQPDRRKLGYTPMGHRLVEVLNVAAIAGLSVAVAGYFWLNRLLPVGLEARSNAEINGFFAIWLACLVHAALRPHAKAWLEQMAVAAVAFALLPLLNVWTGGAGLWLTLAHSQWSVAGFDLMMLALGLVHAAVVAKLWQRRKKMGAVAVPAARQGVASQKTVLQAPENQA
ncbi:MAG: PepSY domain-containing protein [Comamonas sp.]|nr:PepSY domain-containing protein [Comamonas sp.]